MNARSLAKSMQGLDKRYDDHVWTKTMNITNEFDMSFRYSSCVETRATTTRSANI